MDRVTPQGELRGRGARGDARKEGRPLGSAGGPRAGKSHYEGITKFGAPTAFLPNLPWFPSPRGPRCSDVQPPTRTTAPHGHAPVRSRSHMRCPGGSAATAPTATAATAPATTAAAPAAARVAAVPTTMTAVRAGAAARRVAGHSGAGSGAAGPPAATRRPAPGTAGRAALGTVAPSDAAHDQHQNGHHAHDAQNRDEETHPNAPQFPRECVSPTVSPSLPELGSAESPVAELLRD
jgi:hypothetical protein